MIDDRSSNTSRDDDVDDRGDYDYEIFLDVCSALQESDADSSVEEEESSNDKRRKWPSLYPDTDFHPARRIVKRMRQACTVLPTDDRRFYGKLKVDMINCADLTALRNWMDHVYEPGVEYTERYVHYVPDHALYAETHGIDQMHSFHAANLASMPDMTVTYQGSKLTLREDGSSYLVLKLLCQGIFVQLYTFTNATPKTGKFLSKWNLASIFSVAAGNPGRGKNAKHAWKPGPELEATIIQNQVRVATPSTQVIFEPHMQTEPMQFLVEIAAVMYINKNHKIYKEELLKRLLPTTLTIDPYDASHDSRLFGDVEEGFVI